MGAYRTIESNADASGVRAAVVASGYHAEVVDAMIEGAAAHFASCGGVREDLVVVPCPGAFELPTVASGCIESGRFDVLVVLGCLVKGETRHDEVIADAVAGAIARLSTTERVPIGFGLLTVENLEQARARAGGAVGNKGAEAMQAALETLNMLRELGASGRVEV